MQQNKQRNTKKTVLLSLVFGYKSSTVQEVRAVSCPDCRGLSLKSWCLSPSRCHCGYPLPGFSLAVVCGLHRDEPTSPGSRNGHASPQMGPGKRQRHVWKRKRLPFIIFTLLSWLTQCCHKVMWYCIIDIKNDFILKALSDKTKIIQQKKLNTHLHVLPLQMQSLFANALVEIIVFKEGLLHHTPKNKHIHTLDTFS